MSSQPSVPTANALVIDPGVEHTQVEEQVEHTARDAISQPSTPTNALVIDPGVEHIQVEEQVEHTAHNATSLEDLYAYRVYNATGTARAFAGRVTIYNEPRHPTGAEAMYALINRFLERIEWVQLIAWINDTDAMQQYKYSYTTGLTITQGGEVNKGFDLGASYKGMSIGLGRRRRTFKSTETISTQTTAITVNVAPRSQLFFYQRRFDFRDNITFINDAWGEEWNIGPWGGYYPLTTKVCSVKIMAEEYFTKSAHLPEGPGSVAVDVVPPAPLAASTRKRENVTKMAKDKLTRMGL